MNIGATVAFSKNEFIAQLSDGRQIEHSEFRELARALNRAGVRAGGIEYEWRAGQRMLTAGQQVALLAEMRQIERNYVDLSIAA